MSARTQRMVLVTGASRGLGLALTRQYFVRGERVFGGDRATSDLEVLHTSEDYWCSTCTSIEITQRDQFLAGVVQSTRGKL